MNLQDGIHKLEQMKTRSYRVLKQVQEQDLNDAYQLAQEYSSGGVSTAELRRMGHPYARRHPSPLLPPGIINEQEGTFKANWKQKLGEWSGDTLTSHLTNLGEIPGFLQEGTKWMVARPIDKLVLKALAPARRARLRAALKEIFHA